MHRTNIYLSEEQKTRLQEESERTGLSASEIIRRAVDHWLDMKADPLEQFAEQVMGYDREAGGTANTVADMINLIRSMDERLQLMIWAQPEEVRERIQELAEERHGHSFRSLPLEEEAED